MELREKKEGLFSSGFLRFRRGGEFLEQERGRKTVGGEGTGGEEKANH